MVDLARNGAIADAVLISGDEDVRIGIHLAQQYGVRVHLLGVEPAHESQGRSIRQEADTVAQWGRREIEAVLSFSVPSSPVHVEPDGPMPNLDEQLRALIASLSADLVEAARADWVGARRIPPEIDKQVLRIGRLNHRVEALERDETRDIRNRFGAILLESAPS